MQFILNNSISTQMDQKVYKNIRNTLLKIFDRIINCHPCEDKPAETGVD